MKTGKAITIFSVLFLLLLFAGQASAAEGHNYDSAVTSKVGTAVVDCSNCHLQSHADGDTGGFVPRGDVAYDRCFVCHNASGVASTMTIVGNHKTDGSVDCGMCHELHNIATTLETTSTNTRTGVTQKNLSYIRSNMQTAYMTALKGPNSASTNTVFHTKPDDYAFASGSEDTIDTNFPYNGVCQACHSATIYHTQAIQSAGGADADHKIGNNCGICHQHTYTSVGKNNAFIPYHPDSHFGWEVSCQYCHSMVDYSGSGPATATEGVVADVHKFKCELCHTDGNAPNAANATRNGAKGDASLAFGAAGNNFDPATYTCLTCHPGSEKHPIDVTGEIPGRHDISSDSSKGYDCEACHGHNFADATEMLNRHMGSSGNKPADCAFACHNSTPSDKSSINNKLKIKQVTFDTDIDPDPFVDQNPNNFACETCHAKKGDFTMHGLSDDDSADDGMDNGCYTVDKASCATDEVVWHDNLGPAAGEAPTYDGNGGTFTSKLSGAYGGLKVDVYSCDDCHSSDRLDATTLEAMQAHTLGKNGSDCLTCHANGIADFENVVDKGKSNAIGNLTNATGALNTTVNCEDCHATTVNGDAAPGAPYGTGKKMYQYDGSRHHATDHAQAGNCTWCHADPRPNPPTLANGYSSTAADLSSTAPDGGTPGSNAWNTGWGSDYSVTCPSPIPKQVACRLCHTNYGETGDGTPFTADVSGGNGLQGYNQSGTAAQRTTGLTVWANDFNAGNSGAGNNTTVTVNASPITQTEVHRIDANDGSSMINVYDYGACLGCHSVQVMHAAPVPGVDYPDPTAASSNGDCGTVPFDTLRYAPGRAIFNELRGTNDNNQAWNNHRLRHENGIQDIIGSSCQNRGKDWLKGQNGNIWDFNSNLAHTTASAAGFLNANTTNFDSQTGAQIVYFGDITAPAVADNVRFISAVWDGSTVTVEAVNDDGCAALSVEINGTGTEVIAAGGMTGVPCTGTFNIADITGVTLDIITTNANGTDSLNNPIQDNSNQIPVAADDTFNTTYTVAIGGNVSLNDTPGEAPNSWTLVTGVPGGEGTLTFNNDGTFTYNPGMFTGPTSFTYEITDTTPDTSNTATVTINVVDQIPVAQNDTIGVAFGVTYNGNVTVDNGSGADDLGDLPATVNLVADVPVGQGTLTLNADGTFTYDDGGYIGTTSFTYNITDTNGDTSNTATVDLTVEVVPFAADDSFTTDEGVVLNGDVSTNDTGGDPPNTWTLVTSVPGGEGSLTFNSDGTFQYDPGAFIGVTSFTYKIVDNIAPTDSNTATVTITVNDLPVPVDDSFITQPSTVLNGDVSGNDDLGNGLGSINLESGPTNGDLVLNTDGTFTFDPLTMVDGQSATFTYSITDTTPDTSVYHATVTINVLANQAPVAGNDSYTVDQDSANNAFYVLRNDSDPDGDPITLDACNSDAANGTVVLNGDTCEYTPNAGWFGTDTFTYDISDDQGGTDTATVTVTVLECSLNNVTLNGTWSGTDDTTAGTTISYSYGAPAGTNRMMIVVVTHEDTGSETITGVTYNGSPVNEITSQASTDGYVWIGYQLLGTGGAIGATNVQATFTGFVTASRIMVATYDNANQAAPTNSNQQATTNNPSITVANSEGGRVIYGVYFNNTSAITPPAAWTERDDTTVTTGGWGATDYQMGVGDRDATTAGTVTVNPTSAGGSNPTILVGVSIDPTGTCSTNNAPAAAADAANVDEDTSNNIINVLVNDTDPDSDSLAVTTCNTVAPTNGTVVVSPTYASCLYTPDPGYVGADSFDYTITDGGGLTSSATVSITVDNVQDPPVFGSATYTAADATEGVSYATIVAQDATDADGDPITYSRNGGTCGGWATVANDGTISGTPDANVGTTCTVIVRATATGGFDEATVSITVNANAAPVANNDSGYSVEPSSGTTQLTGLLANDSDGGDGGTLSIVSVSNLSCDAGTGQSVAVNADNVSVDFTAPDAEATCTFDYIINDTFYDSAVAATVTVTVSSDRIVCGAANWTPSAGGSCDVDTTGTYFEAENYTSSDGGPNPMTIVAGGGANGSYLLTTATDTASPPNNEIVSYTIDITSAGNYEIWPRLYCVSGSQDSFYVRFSTGGDTGWRAFNCNGTYNTWVWTETMQVGTNNTWNLSAGTHTLQVSGREADTRLDGIYMDLTTGATTPTDANVPSTVTVIDPSGGCAPLPATLDALACNLNGTDGGSNTVFATYNGNTYPMTNIGVNQWELVAEPELTSTYVATITFTSTQDATGLTVPVTNDAGSPSWPTIAITLAEWDGTDTVNVYATSTWGVNDQLWVSYDGNGPVEMTWNGTQSRWEHAFTGYATFVAGDATVTSEGASNSPQTLAVVDSTAVTPFTDYTMDFTGEPNAGNPNTYLSGFGWSQGSDYGAATNGGCFFTGDQQPGSNTSLATMGNPIPFIYRESSSGGGPTCGGYTNGDAFWLESEDLDAGTYTFTLSFDYLYETQAHPATGTGANQIEVWYRNGSGGTWTQLGSDILNASQATENNGTWTNTGALDLSGVLNQAQSRVRILVRSATAPTNEFDHDIGFDNITINGTP